MYDYKEGWSEEWYIPTNLNLLIKLFKYTECSVAWYLVDLSEKDMKTPCYIYSPYVILLLGVIDGYTVIPTLT